MLFYIGHNAYFSDDLYHYGVPGMKWGVRKAYDPVGNGSLKGRGRRLLSKVYSVNERYYSKRGNKMMANANRAAKNYQLKKAEEADRAKAEKKEYANSPDGKAKRAAAIKKAAIIGGSIAAAGLAAYGGYKLYSKQKNAATAKMIENQKRGEQALRAMYDKMSMDAYNNPNTKSFTIRDDKINYYNSWEKK